MMPPVSTKRPARPGHVAFLDGLLLLVGLWLVGEVVGRSLGLPVPGAVLGMLLLVVGLQVRARRGRGDQRADAGSGDVPEGLDRAAGGLLAHLQLLFVPAGVGIVAFLGVVRDDAVPLAGALLVSWALALVVVGWTVTLLLPRRDRRTGSAGEGER